MLKFSTTIDDREIRLALQKLSSAVADLSPAMRDIAAVLADETEQAFEDEANPTTGKPWQDLAQSTKDQRAEKGKWPGKILQLSAGGLAPSISSFYDKESAGVGSNKPYAAIHQYGGKAGRNLSVTIADRPYLGLSKIGEEDILDIIDDHLKKSMAV